MRITGRTVATAALGLTLVACGGTQDSRLTKADTDSMRQQTLDLAAALNAKDAGKAAEFYAATATFMPPNEATVHGRDSVKAFYQTLVDAGLSEVTMDQKEIGGEGPVAFAHGTYSMTVKGQANARHDRGKYLVVFRRNQAGQWRCEYSMWNSDLPQAGEAGDQ